MVELSFVMFSGQECGDVVYYLPCPHLSLSTVSMWKLREPEGTHFPELLSQPLPEQVPLVMSGVFHLCKCPPFPLMGNLRTVLSAHVLSFIQAPEG
jgi:hypothetical protein